MRVKEKWVTHPENSNMQLNTVTGETRFNPKVIAKNNELLKHRCKENKTRIVYELRAKKSGFYEKLDGETWKDLGQYWLNKGEIWGYIQVGSFDKLNDDLFQFRFTPDLYTYKEVGQGTYKEASKMITNLSIAYRDLKENMKRAPKYILAYPPGNS